jgi:hypothetical protein
MQRAHSPRHPRTLSASRTLPTRCYPFYRRTPALSTTCQGLDGHRPGCSAVTARRWPNDGNHSAHLRSPRNPRFLRLSGREAGIRAAPRGQEGDPWGTTCGPKNSILVLGGWISRSSRWPSGGLRAGPRGPRPPPSAGLSPTRRGRGFQGGTGGWPAMGTGRPATRGTRPEPAVPTLTKHWAGTPRPRARGLKRVDTRSQY